MNENIETELYLAHTHNIENKDIINIIYELLQNICNTSLNLEVKNKTSNIVRIKSIDFKNRIANNLAAYIEYCEDSLFVKKNGNNKITISSKENEFDFTVKIQTGNWAMAYKDFFEFITENFDGIQCYIVLSNSLKQYFSDGIVSYNLVDDLFSNSNNLIKNKIIIFKLCQN